MTFKDITSINDIFLYNIFNISWYLQKNIVCCEISGVAVLTFSCCFTVASKMTIFAKWFWCCCSCSCCRWTLWSFSSSFSRSFFCAKHTERKQDSKLYIKFHVVKLLKFYLWSVFSDLDQLVLELLDLVPLRCNHTGLTGQLEFQRGFKKHQDELYIRINLLKDTQIHCCTDFYSHIKVMCCLFAYVLTADHILKWVGA